MPNVVEQALMYRNLDQDRLKEQVELYLNQQFIREELDRRDLVAFVGNDAILPRKMACLTYHCKTRCLYQS